VRAGSGFAGSGGRLRRPGSAFGLELRASPGLLPRGILLEGGHRGSGVPTSPHFRSINNA
jgi:hypothetical protein